MYQGFQLIYILVFLSLINWYFIRSLSLLLQIIQGKKKIPDKTLVIFLRVSFL